MHASERKPKKVIKKILATGNKKAAALHAS
jgi:hypothetical protein